MAAMPLPGSPANAHVCLVGQCLPWTGALRSLELGGEESLGGALVERRGLLDGGADVDECWPTALSRSRGPPSPFDFPPPPPPTSWLITTTSRTATMASIPRSQAARRRRSESGS